MRSCSYEVRGDYTKVDQPIKRLCVPQRTWFYYVECKWNKITLNYLTDYLALCTSIPVISVVTQLYTSNLWNGETRRDRRTAQQGNSVKFWVFMNRLLLTVVVLSVLQRPRSHFFLVHLLVPANNHFIKRLHVCYTINIFRKRQISNNVKKCFYKSYIASKMRRDKDCIMQRCTASANDMQNLVMNI